MERPRSRFPHGAYLSSSLPLQAAELTFSTPYPLSRALSVPSFPSNRLQKKKDKKSFRTNGPKYPTYSGPAPPPNRFNIPPGYRWDGVDRGNGFEAKLMQKRNSRAMTAAAYNAWSMEDM